jgi:acetylornithine deacetylase/succinyl-diaminopimelate desuccinylase
MIDAIRQMNEPAADVPYMLDRLETFVAINTENPPGQEVHGADFLATELDTIGLAIERSEPIPGRANVVGRFSNGVGPVFALNSHIDTVPAGDGWTFDPYRLTRKGNDLFGRGSCDAKGPIIAMLEAARMLIAMRKEWQGELVLIFVFDEEVQSLGAKEYIKSAPRVDYAIVGEPTSNVVYTAHRGSLRVVVRVKGEMAHSSTPELGINPIFRAAGLLRILEEHHEHKLRFRHHPLVGTPTLTVTKINSGIAETTIPPYCDLLIDRRMVPGESRDEVIEEIQVLLRQAEHDLGVRSKIIEFKPTTGPASETPVDHPIVTSALKIAGVYNGAAGAKGFTGGCDLVHFRSLGANGVILGPGSLQVAHKPDEFVPLQQFVDSAAIYRDIVIDMLSPRANA